MGKTTRGLVQSTGLTSKELSERSGLGDRTLRTWAHRGVPKWGRLALVNGLARPQAQTAEPEALRALMAATLRALSLPGGLGAEELRRCQAQAVEMGPRAEAVVAEALTWAPPPG